MNIQFNKNIGLLLLSIYLILIGITALLPGIGIPILVHAILALLAGIFILIGR